MKIADTMPPEHLARFMDLVSVKYGVCLSVDARRSILDREVLVVNEIPRLLLESVCPGEWWDLHLLRSIRDEMYRFSSACETDEE